MEHNLEKKVKYDIEDEYKSLYSWSLIEVIEDETNAPKKWIPFVWSTRFIASKLAVIRRISIEKDYESEEENAKNLTDTSVIVADLYSGYCNDGENLIDFIRYGMFGTDRRIEAFTLKINVATDGIEKCKAWATPSYDYEVDFRNSVESDCVEFNLYLEKDRWESVAQLIQNKSIDSMLVSFSDVSGFYSDWSPSISTNSIKILTSYHSVEGDEKIVESIPKVGDVGEFRLMLYSDKNLNVKLNQSSNSIYPLFDDDFELKSNEFEDSNEVEKSEISHEILNSQMTNLYLLLASFKKILWSIAVLLLFILLK